MNSPSHLIKLLQASVDLVEKEQRIAQLIAEVERLKRIIGLRRLAEDLRADMVNEAASHE